MDLISKEAVVSTIYKRDDRLKKHEVYRSKGGSIDLLGVLPEIRAIPSAFEGMTNGEVIQALFPNSKTETISFNGIRLYIDDEVHTKIADFTYRWWNAPYKAESEEIC